MSEFKKVCPKARTADLIIEDMNDEIIVYDQRNKAAHLLSGVTARVWRQCDGTRHASDIALALDGDDLSSVSVDGALAELEGIGLLDQPEDADVSEVPIDLSRRKMLTHAAGAATFAGATIVTLEVPLAQNVISAICGVGGDTTPCVAACPSAVDLNTNSCDCTTTLDFSCTVSTPVCIADTAIDADTCGCTPQGGTC